MMQESAGKWQYRAGLGLEEVESFFGEGFGLMKIIDVLDISELQYKKVLPKETMLETIKLCLGAKYKNPSSMREDAPKYFSCSSLVSYIYTQVGVWMPSLSIDKYIFSEKIDKSNIKFGDLIFSNTKEGLIRYETVEYKPGTKVEEGVDHVGIYLGDGNVLHASKSIGKVGIENIGEAKNFKNIVGYGRVCDMDKERFVFTLKEDQEFLKDKDTLLKYLWDKKELL